MDKDQKPQPSNDRPAEKKPTPQTGGGNLVWYMLGLGVLLLLMVTLVQQRQRASARLERLDQARRSLGQRRHRGYVDIVGPFEHAGARVSEFLILSDIQIGTSEVKAKVTRQRL